MLGVGAIADEILPHKRHRERVEVQTAKHELNIWVLLVNDLAATAAVIFACIWKVNPFDGRESLVLVELRKKLGEPWHNFERFVRIIPELEPLSRLEQVNCNLAEELLVDYCQMWKAVDVSGSRGILPIVVIAVTHGEFPGPVPIATRSILFSRMAVMIQLP